METIRNDRYTGKQKMTIFPLISLNHIWLVKAKSGHCLWAYSVHEGTHLTMIIENEGVKGPVIGSVVQC